MPLPVTSSAWTLAPDVREAATVANAAVGAWHPLPLDRHMRPEELCRGRVQTAAPSHATRASLGLPFSPHVCDERFQVGHTILNNVCVGQTQDVDSPPGVKRALCGTVGPGVTQRAAHCQ